LFEQALKMFDRVRKIQLSLHKETEVLRVDFERSACQLRLGDVVGRLETSKEIAEITARNPEWVRQKSE
jgi:hypothetical protein